ncbi:MAG TPA: dihydropteroate synthase [Bacillota bacterium]|nr:dihydropteroate synthase [Bacillota bacterium]
MIIVGEKLNSSIPSVLKIFESGDEQAAAALIRQQAKNADMLDINTALCADERGMMAKTLALALETTQCSIMLDSPDPTVILDVACLCGDRETVINSVTPSQRIDELSDLLSTGKYGIVALPVGEAGTPETAQERVRIAELLVNRLVRVGVREDRIYVDALVEAAAFGQNNAKTTLETVSLLKKTLPVSKTVMGVSNVSFGLPARANLNNAFLACAVMAGLDMAIIDAAATSTVSALRAAGVLAGEDEYGIEYIDYIRSL